MFRAAFIVLFSISLSATADPVNEKDRQLLLDRINQFHSAIREGDKQKYADVFSDDFIFTWSRNGQIYNRETILPNVVPMPDYNPINDEFLIRQYGDSAIVNFRVRQKAEDDGARVTFSYSKINGAWKVIATHSTKIVPPQEKEPAESN